MAAFSKIIVLSTLSKPFHSPWKARTDPFTPSNSVGKFSNCSGKLEDSSGKGDNCFGRGKKMPDYPCERFFRQGMLEQQAYFCLARMDPSMTFAREY
jgi:hypothetical protein